MKFFLICLFILSSSISHAFKISPIEVTFDPVGRGAVQTIKVENPTASSIPIEIFAYERSHKNGKEKRTHTNDFYFFPKQFILKPGEKRNIRISWLGERKKGKNVKLSPMQKGKTNIKEEKAYRLEIKQVPVNLKKKAAKTGITFLYNYVASLYVRPEKVKEEIKLLSYKRVGKNLYRVNVKNTGSAHAIFSFYNLISKKSGKVQFVEEMKKQSSEINGINLLPGETRSVELKIQNNLDSGGSVLEFKKRS